MNMHSCNLRSILVGRHPYMSYNHQVRMVKRKSVIKNKITPALRRLFTTILRAISFQNLIHCLKGRLFPGRNKYTSLIKQHALSYL